MAVDKDLDRRLKNIEEKLDTLTGLVTKSAVQETRISHGETEVKNLWAKWDNQVSPHIQSCPKKQVVWLWVVVVPMGLSLLAIAFRLIKS